MKKGCFVQLIILLTIVTAVIVYIIRNHINEFVFEPGGKAIGGIMITELKDKFNFVEDSPEKDSLRILIEDYLNKSNDKNKSASEIVSFLDSLNYIFRDSLVDSSEFAEIKILAGSKK